MPVWNVERWIGKCIGSLKRQNLKELEFIFVDDCGSDDSMAAVESWASEDERVRIIRNEKNMGAGPSRNAGIEIARGEYLSFIDPDDWVSDDFYEALYAAAVECGSDIVKGGRIMTDENGRFYHVSKLNKRIKGRSARPLYCMFTDEHHSAIYRRSLFDDRFGDKGIRYGDTRVAEDSMFLLKVCLKTESIVTVDNASYYYRHRTDAATNIYSLSRSTQQLISLEERLAVLKTSSLADDQQYYLNLWIKYYLTCYCCAVKSENIPEEDSESYTRRLGRIVHENVSPSALMREIPELEVLLEYGQAVPVSRIKGGDNGLVALECWTEFFTAHTDALKKEFYHGYAEAILRYMAGNMRSLSYKKNGVGKQLRELRDQLSKLNKKDRRKVFLCVPSSGIKIISGRLSK